jgi:hypothetical protein
MQCFQNALSYFATAVRYTRKMFMKLTPGLLTVVTTPETKYMKLYFL